MTLTEMTSQEMAGNDLLGVFNAQCLGLLHLDDKINRWLVDTQFTCP